MCLGLEKLPVPNEKVSVVHTKPRNPRESWLELHVEELSTHLDAATGVGAQQKGSIVTSVAHRRKE